MRRITIPFFAGWLIGAVSTLLASVCGLDSPPFDPTLYGIYHVSHNLDFSTSKLEVLLESAGYDLT